MEQLSNASGDVSNGPKTRSKSNVKSLNQVSPLTSTSNILDNKTEMEGTPSSKLKHVEEVDSLLRALAGYINPVLKPGMEGKVNQFFKSIKNAFTRLEEEASHALHNEALYKTLENNLEVLTKRIEQNTQMLTKHTQIFEQQAAQQRSYAVITTKNCLINAQSGQKLEQTTKYIVIVDRKAEKPHVVTKQEFQKIVSPKQLKIQINRIKKVSNGKLVVECNDKISCQTIKQTINNKNDAPIKAIDDIKKLPTVIIRKVDKHMSNEELIDSLMVQNQLNIDELQIPRPKLIFRTKTQNTYNDAVIRVHPKLYTILISLGKIFIGYTAARVEHYTLITQCFKCMGYGHTQKYCTKDLQTCGHCAGNHRYAECPNKQHEPKCVNCHDSRYSNRENVSPHTAISDACNIRLIMKRRIEERTDYGN